MSKSLCSNPADAFGLIDNHAIIRKLDSHGHHGAPTK
jgi:hypothetical protein